MLRGKRRNVVESSDEDEPVIEPVLKATKLDGGQCRVPTKSVVAPTNGGTQHEPIDLVSSPDACAPPCARPRVGTCQGTAAARTRGGSIEQQQVGRSLECGYSPSSGSASSVRSAKDESPPRQGAGFKTGVTIAVAPREYPESPDDEYGGILEEATREAMRAQKLLMKHFGPQSSEFFKNGRTKILKPSTLLDPIGRENKALKDYQRAGIQWLETLLAAKSGAILADEMGLGKTLETLTFLERQFEQGTAPGDGPALIVVPTSLLANWEEEIKRWTSLSVFRYHHSQASVRDELAETYFENHSDTDIILTSPNVLLNQNDRRNFFKRVEPFSFLICDEGHFLRNAQTNKVKCLSNIGAGMRILLTGTPIQNDLSELVNLLWFILPKAFGPVRESFKQKMKLPISEIRKVGAPFILRRSKQDVLGDLPNKSVVTLWCDMDKDQRRAYEDAARGTDQSDFKNMYSRLRRICNGPILAQLKFGKEDYENLAFELRKVRDDYANASDYKVMQEITSWSDFVVHQTAIDHQFQQPYLSTPAEVMAGCKIKALIKLLSERKNLKTLVFSQFTQYLDVLEATLQMHRHKYIRLDGSTPTDQRQELVNTFNAPDGPSIFMLSTKAGGTGLNLVAADACVLMDLDFNPQNNRQAEDRIHRLGQTKDVTIYYMICRDTIEEKILEVDARKMQLDVKFGGNKQDADSKIMKWIMEKKSIGIEEFMSTQ